MSKILCAADNVVVVLTETGLVVTLTLNAPNKIKWDATYSYLLEQALI